MIISFRNTYIFFLLTISLIKEIVSTSFLNDTYIPIVLALIKSGCCFNLEIIRLDLAVWSSLLKSNLF